MRREVESSPVAYYVQSTFSCLTSQLASLFMGRNKYHVKYQAVANCSVLYTGSPVHYDVTIVTLSTSLITLHALQTYLRCCNIHIVFYWGPFDWNWGSTPWATLPNHNSLHSPEEVTTASIFGRTGNYTWMWLTYDCSTKLWSLG